MRRRLPQLVTITMPLALYPLEGHCYLSIQIQINNPNPNRNADAKYNSTDHNRLAILTVNTNLSPLFLHINRK